METNLQFNAGVDFALFNKLTGSFDSLTEIKRPSLSLPMAPSNRFTVLTEISGTYRTGALSFSKLARYDRENFK
jgi:hypothetical protein